MKPYSDMMPAEREAKRAELTAHLAERPEAIEVGDAAPSNPGAIFFIDGRYAGVSPDIASVWPAAEWWIGALFDLQPQKHQLDYWRARIESGATLLAIFRDVGGDIEGAGIVNCSTADDGTPITLAMVMTFDPVDLTDLSQICECVAVMTESTAVVFWGMAASDRFQGRQTFRTAAGSGKVAGGNQDNRTCARCE